MCKNTKLNVGRRERCQLRGLGDVKHPRQALVASLSISVMSSLLLLRVGASGLGDNANEGIARLGAVRGGMVIIVQNYDEKTTIQTSETNDIIKRKIKESDIIRWNKELKKR